MTNRFSTSIFLLGTIVAVVAGNLTLAVTTTMTGEA